MYFALVSVIYSPNADLWNVAFTAINSNSKFISSVAVQASGNSSISYYNVTSCSGNPCQQTVFVQIPQCNAIDTTLTITLNVVCEKVKQSSQFFRDVPIVALRLNLP